MTVTVDQLVNYFNKIESLLTEFNTTQGYHSFLGVLQLGDSKNTKNSWKNPRANGANGSTNDGKGKKGKDGGKGEGKSLRSLRKESAWILLQGPPLQLLVDRFHQ
eukprot:760115-Amphidinium_carterae.1